jgi:flagellum-specific peptidoglycan hydrolase FlgJ
MNNADIEANDYIDQYSELAVIEMYRTGIPASITLAQALHESNVGKSDLATRANNHFGIKCKSYWKGSTYFHEDDDLDDAGRLIESCFRSYETVHDSYIDHSNFLKYTENYQNLFSVDIKDYKGWAYGLKSSGYATDIRYSEKLIKYIEKYQLHHFDNAENPYLKLRKLKTLTTNN